jgi:uncharacterized membrane protein SirB2
MTDFGHWLQITPLSIWVKNIRWLIPLLQSIHIVCIGLVVVSSLMIVLRILGHVRADESFGEVWQRFAPWMWGGLVVMLLTGLVLVIGEPVREFTALSFWMKMTLIAVSAITMGTFGVLVRPSNLGSGREFSLGVKSAAVGTMLVWFAIIFLGRAIAYDTEVWGHLSHHSQG